MAEILIKILEKNFSPVDIMIMLRQNEKESKFIRHSKKAAIGFEEEEDIDDYDYFHSLTDTRQLQIIQKIF